MKEKIISIFLATICIIELNGCTATAVPQPPIHTKSVISERVIKQNIKTTNFALIKSLAENGDAKSQYLLGEMYFKGNNVIQDYSLAEKWFLKSADQGNTDAQTAIGSMYLNGYGVRQNPITAMEWHKKSASLGNSTAQAAIGLMYFKGNGITKSYPDAINWFKKSASLGNSTAQYYLGGIYGNGAYGVKADESIAKEWFGKSCDNKNLDGCKCYIGKHYNGCGW